jgi:hypothetical protein
MAVEGGAQMKKRWQQPQLISLTRSKPEEAILTFCKTVFGATGTPTSHEVQCDVVTRCSGCVVIWSS